MRRLCVLNPVLEILVRRPQWITRSMPKLAIIVPYRNRAAHLDAFIPHVRAYFARDKVDRVIDYRVYIVEQDGDLPFNRGALLDRFGRASCRERV